jgi:hypothetical protein
MRPHVGPFFGNSDFELLSRLAGAGAERTREWISGFTTETRSSAEVAQRRQAWRNSPPDDSLADDSLLSPSATAPNEPNARSQTCPIPRLAANRRRAPIVSRPIGSSDRHQPAPTSTTWPSVTTSCHQSPRHRTKPIYDPNSCLFNDLRHSVAAHRTSRIMWPRPRGATNSLPSPPLLLTPFPPCHLCGTLCLCGESGFHFQGRHPEVFGAVAWASFQMGP